MQNDKTQSAGLNILAWVLQIAVAAIFILAGSAKVAGIPQMVEVFAKVGVGQWFRYVTATIEIAGALALLRPRTAPLAAPILIVTMIGAGFTDVFILKHSPGLAVGLIVALSAILWIRRAWLPGNRSN